MDCASHARTEALIKQIKDKLPHDVWPIIGRLVRPHVPRRCGWCLVLILPQSPQVRSCGKAYLCSKQCMLKYLKTH